jgi:cell division protein FtsI/penicillin-binding protein 2
MRNQSSNSNFAHRKIRLVYTIVFVFAGLLALFALRWQVIEAEKFGKYANARLQVQKIPALRGTIYAADGSTLAYSEPLFNLFVYRPWLAEAQNLKLHDQAEFVRKLAPMIDTTPEELNRLLNNSFNADPPVWWIKVAEGLPLETGEKIKALTIDKDVALKEPNRRKLRGYDLLLTTRRVYPEGRLASQIVGLTEVIDTEDTLKTVGRGGLEQEWNELLEPRIGFISGEVDAKGNAVGFAAEKTKEAIRGSSIYTAINKRVQKSIEEKLEWGIEKFGATSGTIVVMEPTTGYILGIANYPTYNPNSRETADQSAFGNKAVTEPYEIGSVGKTFALAAALDLKVVTRDTVLLPQGHKGCEEITKELPPVCTADKKPQGPMNMADAFRKSDNLYFFHLAKKMRPQDFYNYLRAFGVGKPSGIDLYRGGDPGSIKDYKRWNIADISAYSYGHSYQVTAIQATTAIGAIANRGTRMKPQILTKVVEPSGKIIEYRPEAVETVISKETAALMDEIMHNVYLKSINPGEYHYYDLKNYYIAMKSGTALIPDVKTKKYTGEYNGTYVGYDASPDHKFVMLVRLERPKVGDLSIYNARILWLETFAAIKDTLGVRRKGQW